MQSRVLIALSLALWASCGGSEQSTTPTTAPAPNGGEAPANAHETRDTLVIGYPADANNLLFVVSEAVWDTNVSNSLAVPIIDSEFDCSLKKKPGLFKDWKWSDDGKIITVTMRDDISWEDGTKVSAQDVAFTWDLIADPEVASPRLNWVERLVEGKRPLIVNDTTLEWHFTEAYDRDTQTSHISGGVLAPMHLLKDADRKTLRGHEVNAQSPVSYGPWTLKTWEKDQRIVLEPNPKFTGPDEWRPNLNRVVFKITPEYQTRLLELKKGAIDMMDDINIADADRLRREHPEIRLVRRGWRSNDYVAWNLQNPLFADKQVRHALAKAVNVDEMIGKLLTSETGESYAKRMVGTITPALCGVHNESITPIAQNVEEAKAMFAKAGWTDSNGDGILDKGGKKFSFTLSTNSSNSVRVDAQVLLQSQLKAVGVEVNLETLDTNAFYDNLRKRDFDAALAGWSAALYVDPTPLWQCETEAKKHEFNFTSYCNEDVDALIAKGMATADPKEAAPVWQELQAKIHDDQPYLNLWWKDEIVGLNERFEDYQIDVLSAYGHLHKWKVPEDKVKYKR